MQDIAYMGWCTKRFSGLRARFARRAHEAGARRVWVHVVGGELRAMVDGRQMRFRDPAVLEWALNLAVPAPDLGAFLAVVEQAAARP